MTELRITLDVLKRLHRDIENKIVLPANRISTARHALALADKCDRLSTEPIPEVAVIRTKLLTLLPKKPEVKPVTTPAPTKKVNRKKPS